VDPAFVQRQRFVFPRSGRGRPSRRSGPLRFGGQDVQIDRTRARSPAEADRQPRRNRQNSAITRC
jgi:hypothetical protein